MLYLTPFDINLDNLVFTQYNKCKTGILQVGTFLCNTYLFVSIGEGDERPGDMSGRNNPETYRE